MKCMILEKFNAPLVLREREIPTLVTVKLSSKLAPAAFAGPILNYGKVKCLYDESYPLSLGMR